MQSAEWRWEPDRRRLRKLPRDFAVPFQVFEQDGRRFIRPQGPVPAFIERCFVGGLAIQGLTQQLSHEAKQTYRLMSLLFRWSESPRRLHCRHISRIEDLHLTTGERQAISEDSVLPDSLIRARGIGRAPISPEGLIQAGRSHAEQFGVRTDDIARLLDYGLLSIASETDEVAERIQPTHSEWVLRHCLLDDDRGSPERNQEVVEEIEGRFIRLLEKHLSDDSRKFDSWMKDFSTVTRTIAKQKGDLVVTANQVRSVLLDLLWRAHAYASRCVAVQMVHIARSFRPSLSEPERRDFRIWYAPQASLAELAPVVLHGRLQIVAPTLGRIADEPDSEDRCWKACLQALWWKKQIVEIRRKADQARKAPNGLQRELQLDEALQDSIDHEGRIARTRPR